MANVAQFSPAVDFSSPKPKDLSDLTATALCTTSKRTVSLAIHFSYILSSADCVRHCSPTKQHQSCLERANYQNLTPSPTGGCSAACCRFLPIVKIIPSIVRLFASFSPLRLRRKGGLDLGIYTRISLWVELQRRCSSRRIVPTNPCHLGFRHPRFLPRPEN